MAIKSTPKAQRARRPDTRPVEIMEAAQVLFSTQGFRATSLDQVAEAAGVTKGAIYHYFTGKEDLLLRSLNLWLENHWFPPAGAIEGEKGPASARLRLFLRHMWKMSMDPGILGLVRLMEGELVPDFPELMERWHTESILPVFQVFIDLLEEGKKSGEFRKDLDSPVVVRFIIMGINKVAAMQAMGPPTPFRQFPPDRVIDSIMEILFRGLRSAPEP